MTTSDPQIILDEEISATTLALAALTVASLLSLGVFVFLVSHDIVRKLLGTSIIGFLVFGVLGFAKLGDLVTLRRLNKELFVQELTNLHWIRISCRQNKGVRTSLANIVVPDDALSVTIEFNMGTGGEVKRKLGKKFAKVFLPALFAQRPQWLALLRQ